MCLYTSTTTRPAAVYETIHFVTELPIEQVGMTQGQMPRAWKEDGTMPSERKSGETVQKQKGKPEPQ